MPNKVANGTIRVSKNGAKYIKVNGKWEYMKKPKEQWKVQGKQLTEERIEKIRSLFGEGKSYDYISKTVGCNKSTIVKYCKDLGVGDYDYPPVRIPENMRETLYPGYYITEDGDAYREPGRYDRNGQYGKVNEWGLIYLKPALRGNPNTSKDKMYYCVNISIRDENGKFLKQIKKSNHQLVAEVFVPNPEGYTEILHLDDNNRNNHYSNLKWGLHEENMRTVISPCTQPKTYAITDLISGQVWKGYNLTEWVRNHMDLILPRVRNGKVDHRSIARNMSNVRSTGGKIWNFKVEY